MRANNRFILPDRTQRNVESGVVLGLRMVLGAVLLYAGAAKLLGGFEFFATLSGYELGGMRTTLFLASVIPGVEVVIGFMLLSGIAQSAAFLAGLLCAMGFVGAQAFVLFHGLRVPCGCFGGGAAELIGFHTLARAVLMMLALGLGLGLSRMLEHSGSGESQDVAGSGNFTQHAKPPIPAYS
jgi:uncharacterized membrane protein YphA (DoxX/SURF4 family)